MMRKIIFSLCGILWFTLAISPAFAAPSMSGSTGMIRIPTADVLRPGQAGAGYYFWQDQSRAVLALGAVKGLELSAAAPWRNGTEDAWSVNAKISLLQEELLLPAVAVGIEDAAGRDRRSVYGVISKALPYGLRVHIGTGTGRFDGMFGAVEKVLNPVSVKGGRSGFPVTSLIVEMDGGKMNYGLRLRLDRGLRLDCGWLVQDEKVYFGLTYTH